jgi:hypothetical protein
VYTYLYTLQVKKILRNAKNKNAPGKLCNHFREVEAAEAFAQPGQVVFLGVAQREARQG